MAKHIIVGLSGGVDSAVSAWLLKNQGYKVTGLFMKNWEDDDDDEYCTSKQDLIDAVSVSEKIGIDIEVVNFAKEYKKKVFSLFISGLEKGITPNPDILCNSEIKFEAFLKHAFKMGASKIADRLTRPALATRARSAVAQLPCVQHHTLTNQAPVNRSVA